MTSILPMNRSNEADIYDRMPKVELHAHALGSTRISTALDFAARSGKKLPSDDPAFFQEFGSLDDFRQVLAMFRAEIHSAEDWERIGYETLLDATYCGLRYRELHFNPSSDIERGQSLESIIAGLSSGFTVAESERGARCMLIVSCDRTLSPRKAVELVGQLAELRRAGKAERVIGIGIDGPDPGIGLDQWSDAFLLARSVGLRLTAHSQDGGPRNVRSVLDDLHVERVDHAMDILDDPVLTRRVAETRVPITVCPNSNVRISRRYETLGQHPFRRMREAGLLATLNTDDPGMMGIDLGEEYRSVARALHLDFAAMTDVALDGIEASWLDDSDKRSLRVVFQSELETLREEATENGGG